MENAKKLAVQAAAKAELDELRKRVATTIEDAKTPGLSPEGRYVRAYDAVRQIATIAIRASGRRVSAKVGHHAITFEALEALDPATFATAATFCDSARNKRNDLEYTAAVPPSETDSNELVKVAEALINDVEEWIVDNHPTLKRST